MIRRSRGERVFDMFNTILLVLVIIITLYPMIYVFNASISDPFELMRDNSLLLLPKGIQFEAYKKVFENPMFFTGYKNTIIYVVGGTVISLIMTSLGAYALSRKGVFGTKVIMKLIIFTMFFSGGMVPTFLLVQKINIYNTIWAMLLPTAINTWNLILMKTNFESLPDGLIESAKIDGANDIQILYKIVLPLSKPIIAVMALYYSVGYWNDFMTPLLYLRDRSLYPIQIVLREILLGSTDSMTQGVATDSAFQIGENIKYASIIVSALPVIMIYPFIQKYFVQGAMIGAVKG